MSISSRDEPQNYEVAIQKPLWVHAMKDELVTVVANQTWSIIDLPPGKSTIRCRWIYKIKYLSNGTIERHKVNLVAVRIDGLNKRGVNCLSNIFAKIF